MNRRTFVVGGSKAALLSAAALTLALPVSQTEAQGTVLPKLILFPTPLDGMGPPAPFQFRAIPKGQPFGMVAMKWDYDRDSYGAWIRYAQADLDAYMGTEDQYMLILKAMLLNTVKEQFSLLGRGDWDRDVKVQIMKSGVNEDDVTEF